MCLNPPSPHPTVYLAGYGHHIILTPPPGLLRLRESFGVALILAYVTPRFETRVCILKLGAFRCTPLRITLGLNRYIKLYSTPNYTHA